MTRAGDQRRGRPIVTNRVNVGSSDALKCSAGAQCRNSRAETPRNGCGARRLLPPRAGCGGAERVRPASDIDVFLLRDELSPREIFLLRAAGRDGLTSLARADMPDALQRRLREMCAPLPVSKQSAADWGRAVGPEGATVSRGARPMTRCACGCQTGVRARSGRRREDLCAISTVRIDQP